MASFKSMDARLKKAQRQREPRPEHRHDARPLGLALRLSVELAAGLVVGGGMGYVLDRWLGTGPWLFIVFFFFGAAAGIRNVMRTAAEINRKMTEDVDGQSDDQGEKPPAER